MKTAVSVPDDLFGEAEQYAKKCGLSRSELYAAALRDYLKTRSDAAIIKAINESLGDQPETIEPAWIHAQVRAVGKEDW